ncbi:hypothetical protein U1Q18_003532 [Sarracenia purpurea var. burkii]
MKFVVRVPQLVLPGPISELERSLPCSTNSSRNLRRFVSQPLDSSTLMPIRNQKGAREVRYRTRAQYQARTPPLIELSVSKLFVRSTVSFSGNSRSIGGSNTDFVKFVGDLEPEPKMNARRRLKPKPRSRKSISAGRVQLDSSAEPTAESYLIG